MLKRLFPVILSLCLIFLMTSPCFAAEDKQVFETEKIPVSTHETIWITPNFSIGNIDFENIEKNKAFFEINNSTGKKMYVEIMVFLYNNLDLPYAKTFESVIDTYDSFFVSEKNYIEKENENTNFSIVKFADIKDEIKSYKFEIKYKEVTEHSLFLEAVRYENYYIDDYNIDIVVNEDRSLNISETITAEFNTPHHGIFRKLPLLHNVERADGTSSVINAKISDVQTNTEKSVYKESNSYVIKLGDPDKTVTGKQLYEIKYKYDLGRDTSWGYDELYLDLIGTYWEAPLNDIDFTIKMPKAFDADKLGFSTGSYGVTGSDRVTYEINGNTITGSCQGYLTPGEALTVRLELPDEYFIKTPVKFTAYHVFYIIFCIITLVITLLLYNKYGKDDKLISSVEFYPPEDMNSLELGYWYKGMAENKGVVSLVIYLANKGYLKIKELESDKKYSSKFKFIKIKDYDGNNDAEKEFFKGLFEDGATEVYENELVNSFYRTVLSTKEKATNNNPNKNEIYTKKSNKAKKISSFIIFTAIILAFPVLLASSLIDQGGIILIGFFSIFFFMLLFLVANVYEKFLLNIKKKKIKFSNIFALCFVLSIFIAFFLYAKELLSFMFNINTASTITLVIGLIFVVASYSVNVFILKRNEYSHKILEKITGFKNFLETAEKEKLEALVKENPNYFFDILPYTYVLDISDKWINKFESIAISPPEWHVSSQPFSITTMNNFISDAMYRINGAMTSSPSSSSGGGGGGGGFSGGGAGGGGGGAW